MLYYVLGIALHEKQEKHQESIGMDPFLQGTWGTILKVEPPWQNGKNVSEYAPPKPVVRSTFS